MLSSRISTLYLDNENWEEQGHCPSSTWTTLCSPSLCVYWLYLTSCGNKSLSLSQLDTPQPCLWLLRPTQQTEVDIKDLPAGYLVIPPCTQGDLKKK